MVKSEIALKKHSFDTFMSQWCRNFIRYRRHKPLRSAPARTKSAPRPAADTLLSRMDGTLSCIGNKEVHTQ